MLNEKLVLVTGASRGIGKAIALTLGNAGATVIGTATSDEGASNITKIFTENNILGKGMMLNVTDNEQISELLKSITADYGSVDILVNNAGITRDNILVRMKEDEWDDIINTNLSSVYKMSKAVLRGMIKKRSGRIISITSVVGSMGNAGQSNYGAAKAGIIGFTKSLAREVGVRGITVNAVAPGFIDVHGHVEGGESRNPLAGNFIYDGVTTVITGNCGGSADNLNTYFNQSSCIKNS